jgi:hypothetical protein
MRTAETPALNDEFYNEEQAAKFLNLSMRTLQNFRVSGLGPVYCRVGKRRLGYFRSDLFAFMKQRRFTSTSEEGAQRAASSSREVEP